MINQRVFKPDTERKHKSKKRYTSKLKQKVTLQMTNKNRAIQNEKNNNKTPQHNLSVSFYIASTGRPLPQAAIHHRSGSVVMTTVTALSKIVRKFAI